MKQIESFIRHWQRAVLLMILGGVIGYILWMFLPQQYTAITRLAVSIDYNRTGKLDDLEEDRLLGITEDIIHSRAVMEQVWQHSGEADYQTFFDHTLTTRTNETWSLAITGSEPEATGRLSMLWLDTAHTSLQEAREHAILAEAYQNQLDGLSRCIQESIRTAVPAGCSENTEETFRRIGEYAQAIQDEQELSHGLSAAVLIGQKNTGQLEIRPASRNAAADTLFGALTGLLISFAFVWFEKNGNEK